MAKDLSYWMNVKEQAVDLWFDLADEAVAIWIVLKGMWNLVLQICALGLSLVPVIRSVCKQLKEFKKEL